MRKKLLSKTYLRDALKYEIKFFVGGEKCNIAVKKLIKLKEPFVISSGKTLMDDGYYIIEVVPHDENYGMRVYLDDKKNILQFYFDISLGNGVDEETKIPYYDDLFTDVTITDGKVAVLDEDELLEALNSGRISKDDFDLANRATEKLLAEIEAGTNEYMKMDFESLLWWDLLVKPILQGLKTMSSKCFLKPMQVKLFVWKKSTKWKNLLFWMKMET